MKCTVCEKEILNTPYDTNFGLLCRKCLIIRIEREVEKYPFDVTMLETQEEVGREEGEEETNIRVVKAIEHHRKHGDMDGHICLLNKCVLHYPEKETGKQDCKLFKAKEVYRKCRYCVNYRLKHYRPYCVVGKLFLDEDVQSLGEKDENKSN